MRRERALVGLFLALATYTLASFLWGRVASAGTTYAAFAGLAQSKNAAGDTAALTLLASFASRRIGPAAALASADRSGALTVLADGGLGADPVAARPAPSSRDRRRLFALSCG